ncbi:MAG: extracellular solute-binding protein [Janthinobacterium lividum]
MRNHRQSPLSRRGYLPFAAVLLLGSTAAHAVPLSLYAAGSLSAALTKVAVDYTAATGTPVTTTFQASGTIRQEIEAGTVHPDVFASADTGNPLTLRQEGLSGPVVNFASNRVVAVAKSSLGLTSATILSTLLSPSISIGTSTPVSDPLGDYTEQVFSLADGLSPGAKSTLDAKAKRLVGGPASPPVPAGQNSLVYFVDVTAQANVFLTYYTSAVAALALDTNLVSVDLPSNLAVAAQYGETVLNGANPAAQSLADYILSPAAQAVLASNGFGPPAAVPEPKSWVLLAIGLVALVIWPRHLAQGRNRPASNAI